MRKLTLLAVAMCMLLAPVLASADDIMPAPWRGGINSIYSIWDDWKAYIPGAQVEAPDNGGTPIGTPLLVAENTIMQGPSAGIMAFDTPAPEHPYIVLDVPNYPNLQQVKQIRVQITFEPNYNNAGSVAPTWAENSSSTSSFPSATRPALTRRS